MYQFETMTPELVQKNEASLLALAADQPDEYWTIEHFLLDLQDKWDLSFVALSRNVIIGYAILSRRDVRTVHLHHFMIHPSERGKGLGNMMLLEMEKRVKNANANALSLKFHINNNRIRCFYERHGFIVTGPPSTYRVMTKILG